MANHQTTEDQGTALETTSWLSLKDASAEAQCCDATIKRAIKSGKLEGRKAGTGCNASYEVSKDSLGTWMAATGKSKHESPLSAQQQEAKPVAPPPGPNTSPAAKGAVEPSSKPHLTKAERRKLKAANRTVIPESARRLRRWKNFMRHADQQQALAMIKWLSARLAPKKSLSKKIAKEALNQSKANTKPPQSV